MHAHERMDVRNKAGACPAFEWLGQGLDHCDRCGAPYWEHTHEDVGLRVHVTGRGIEGMRRVRRLIPASWHAQVRRQFGLEGEVPC